MKVEIIIPNYNGFELMQKNLPKVINAASSYKDVSITIVDDRSHEPERGKLREFIEKVKTDVKVPIKLLEHSENKGFSSTVNTGAFNSDADVFIFLNTDVIPENKFVEQAVAHFKEHEKLFGVGFTDKSVEGEKIVLRGRGIGKWERGFLHHARGEVDKTNTLWVSGGSSAVRASFFRELDGFDELYDPFYWEDIDLSYRAQKRGYFVIFDKNIEVEHRHAEGSIKKHYKSQKIKKIAYRNQFIFHWKNISDSKLLVSHFAWLPYHTLRAIMRGDQAFISGLFMTLARLGTIIKKRKLNMKKVSDKEILDQFEL